MQSLLTDTLLTDSLLIKLSNQLIDKNIKLITVESCTGGWLGKLITDQTGSSDWYECGLITYSNESKQKLVGVGSDLLDKYGAVSEQVALAMSKGAAQLIPNCIGLSVTGIAGPGGGSDEKPIGLAYLSVTLESASKTIKCNFEGNREDIRRSAVRKGFNLVSEFINHPTDN